MEEFIDIAWRYQLPESIAAVDAALADLAFADTAADAACAGLDVTATVTAWTSPAADAYRRELAEVIDEVRRVSARVVWATDRLHAGRDTLTRQWVMGP